ncbi:hypothetical protein [Microbispora sp. NBRC 16548]|uniref:hypothetical protein n=1 Tax=Microbispora sp. NBRC 16548 TaxID=3030994 RepID=UPI0024A282A4|nr:hypothetical protein [Microbispora sp. NBRC 16548]GLX06797.1 hypothetical protein Misp03_37240 [Microbispora sp. NBRC 16548]
MSTTETIIGIAAGLAVTELTDISPWAARKIVTWSAHLKYGKSPRAAIRAEELCALVDSRPGKLFKLVTALTFAVGATGAHAYRTALTWRLSFEIRTMSRSQISAEIELSSDTEERLSIVVASNLISVGVDLDQAESVGWLMQPASDLVQHMGRANRRRQDDSGTTLSPLWGPPPR